MADELTQAGKIRKRLDQHKKVRSTYEPLWEDITTYIAPRRSDINFTEQKGKKKGLSIYDGTPGSACQLMADGYFGYLISPDSKWFRQKMRFTALNDIPEVKAYLQDYDEQLFYALSRSNFYDCAPEYLYDGGSIGTAVMYAEEDMVEGKIVYSVRHPGECYIAQNRHGQVDTLFRVYEMTARNAGEHFETSKMSNGLKDAVEKNPESTYKFIHAVYPREDRELDKSDSVNKRFASVYIELAGSNEILSQGGYDSFPYFVWRYRKNSHEIYGRSPGADALVEVMSLNQVAKTNMSANQLAVEPAYNVPKEMRGNVRIAPRGLNYYDEKDRGITPIHIPSNLAAGLEAMKRLEDAIEKHYRVEFFTLLSRAAMEGRTLTVPQVLEMQGEKAALMGPIIGRQNTEFHNPLLDRTAEIETRAGRMPDPPQVLADYEGERTEVEYLGPLAQAHKKMFTFQNINQGVQAIGQLSETYPEARDRLNPDVIADELLDALNFPQKAIVPLDRANKVREARNQQAQQMQMAAMAAEAAKAVPGLSKGAEPGSVMEQINAAGGG